MSRSQVISELADMIAKIHLDHPVRIGIDGVEASVKQDGGSTYLVTAYGLTSRSNRFAMASSVTSKS